MDVTINGEIKVSSDNIKIGKYTLSEILNQIHSKTTDCLQDISIERQSENPNLVDIDSPLHGVLNLIEEIRNY